MSAPTVTGTEYGRWWKRKTVLEWANDERELYPRSAGVCPDCGEEFFNPDGSWPRRRYACSTCSEGHREGGQRAMDTWQYTRVNPGVRVMVGLRRMARYGFCDAEIDRAYPVRPHGPDWTYINNSHELPQDPETGEKEPRTRKTKTGFVKNHDKRMAYQRAHKERKREQKAAWADIGTPPESGWAGSKKHRMREEEWRKFLEEYADMLLESYAQEVLGPLALE